VCIDYFDCFRFSPAVVCTILIVFASIRLCLGLF